MVSTHQTTSTLRTLIDDLYVSSTLPPLGSKLAGARFAFPITFRPVRSIQSFR